MITAINPKERNELCRLVFAGSCGSHSSYAALSLQSLSEIQKNFSSVSLFQCHGINDSDRTQQRTITFIVRRAGLLRVLYADKRACGGDRRGHINFYSGICHLLSFPRLFLPIVFKKSYRFNSNLGAECRKSVLSSRSFHMVDSDESFSSFINCPRRGRFVLLSLILDLFHVSQSKSGKKKRKQPKERHT